MNKDFYKGNRERLYAQLQENSLLVLFAGRVDGFIGFMILA